jgi:YggT family protein
MEALVFLIDTLVGLYLFVLLLRLLLQFCHADFRNPIARGVVQLSNPLILPLRRLLPAAGRVDTASVVAVVAVMAAKILVLLALSGLPMPAPLLLARLLLVELARLLLQTYFFAILLYAVMSFVAHDVYSPVQALLSQLCEPVLRPIRKTIPAISGLDLSPLWAVIAIQALLLLIR